MACETNNLHNFLVIRKKIGTNKRLGRFYAVNIYKNFVFSLRFITIDIVYKKKLFSL